jgi:hypothetical protein
MIPMSRSRRPQSFLIWLMLSALLFASACSRPVGLPSEEGSSQTGQAPFHDVSSSAAESSAPDSVASGSSLPFHDAQNLPAGTMLVVRLKGPVSASTTGVANFFQASVDQPIVIEGNTLIPRGAVVTGHVQSARSSKVKPGRGYVQLALNSVRLAGADLPVQAASLFVRQSQKKDALSSTFHLEKGHRLTFRLTEPIFTATQTSVLTSPQTSNQPSHMTP